ncbi:MAG: glycoside hydrolase TIM-barrel-like domain-containing protein, partial [Pseudomonadota bacterium]|nr:glycoside hydrolase TIM-barrel-like domain-containing protein [Pseudomonadota bacterium]
MASIVLGAAGTAAGAATGVPFASAFGGGIGRALGGVLGSALLMPARKLRPLNGPRLASLGVQSSTYGKMIPIVYGMLRIGGNIIWSQPITETVTTTTSSAGGIGKGGGGKVTQTATTYSYSVTLAIGICEGPVDDVLRIWADAEQLDLSQYTLRIYKGDETQLPDSLIQSIEGAANTPAYRGLAYVVFENFPMGDYGNRIPNFTFEVKRKFLAPDYNNQMLEDMITGMVIIPGGGEFVYDTQVEYKIPGAQVGASWVQQGDRQAINMHNPAGKANALLSLDQLQATCPNVQWVSVVVSWFGTDMNAGTCIVQPGVEYQTGAATSPDTWAVGSYTRSTAHLIIQVSGGPQYGGTPDDDSILRYLTELKNRGYKIVFYPLMFMDVIGKPWRGDLTGSAIDVTNFFTKINGYNDFINYYASLVAGKVDAFIIGSELKGLTAVTDTPGNYPAVNALVSLAATVKTTLGSGVKVTYAADWSEYHHDANGYYNLDPLWASSNIDVIGIDAYFPLTDGPQEGYDVATVIAGWTSGEGYDWYYSDTARTVKTTLTAPYAWKNISWFWNNTHTNPDSTTTAWTPGMKKIWFTEYGFPSVDAATNQPNVFYDPNTTGSAFPYYSKGRVDFLAQRVGLTATQQQWAGSSMIEQMFVWTWDARPFPYWPDLTAVWTDGMDWQTGHWVEGKLGTSSLAAVVADLCGRGGLLTTDIDVSQLIDLTEGFVIDTPQTIRSAIEILQQAYFFDAVESDNILKFVPRGGAAALNVPEDDLIPPGGKNSGQVFAVTRAQEIELPKRVNVVYLTRLSNYQSATQYAQREVTSSLEAVTLDLPIVCDDQIGKNIADITLFSDWMARTSYQFNLGVKYAQLEPSDVITAVVEGITHRMRITSTRMATPSVLRVQGVAEDASTFDFYTTPGASTGLLQQNSSIPATMLDLLDIPAFPGDDADKGVVRLAVAGLASGWVGTAIYRSDDGGADYNFVTNLTTPATMGTASTALAGGPTGVFDEVNTVTVLLLGNAQLQSASELAVLNGANAAVLGNEIIQFTTATLVTPGQYTLSGLLRGRLGTEWAVSGHTAGEPFALLDGSVGKQIVANNMIGLLREYKPVTF